jgi:hypothetical protein
LKEAALKVFGASVRIAALAPLIVYARLESGKQPWSTGFAPTLLARLLEMAVRPRFTQRTLAIQLLLQPAQGLLHRLTFF